MTKLAGTKFTLGQDFRITDRQVIELSQSATGSVSVLDFGAVGDGVADDTAAFAAAAAAYAGTPIIVPPGTYRLDSNVTATGRVFVLLGVTLTGTGRLVGALVERISATTGERLYGVGESLQYGSYYRFGRNAGGPIGLVIGGGDPADGDGGNVVYPDVHQSWTTMMPVRYPSSAELAIQPASIAGECSLAISGNTVTRTSGASFIAEMVGQRIYLGQGRYLVATVNVGAQTLTVTELNGSAVSFGSAGPVTFVYAGVKGTGTCSVSGATVTRISGDPFVPLSNTEYRLTINGVSRTVSAVPNFNTITLSAAPGDLASATYEWWTSIDDIMSAIRVHRVSGAGFEENVTLAAHGNGEFHLHAAGGTTRQYPFYIGTGYDGAGIRRKTIALQADGALTLGGDAGGCSLRVDDRDSVASNGVGVTGAAAGSTPAIYTLGLDTDVGLTLTSKGNGTFRFMSQAFGRTHFQVLGNASGTSWLAADSDAFGAPKLLAAGTASDIDVQLLPKGGGRVLIGPWTSSSDASVNGYIEVKDSSGNVRKVATIA